MCCRILVVEDEQLVALDIKSRLIGLGHQVVAIADRAQTALAAVEQHRPELILMDIRLKGESNGIEAATQIWQQYQVPVIFLTAHADEDTLLQVKAAQPFGYLVKPIETQNLSTAIEVALYRYQAEATIQKALATEKELNELRSQFVGIVSHEFRNPLSAIIFTLRLLECHGQQLEPEKFLEHLRRANLSVAQLTQLVDDFLVVSELEAPQFHCQPQPLDVGQFCRELIEQFQSDPGLTQTIQLNITRDQGLASQHYGLDAKLLRHILTNLLSNARKYSPPTSQVDLDLTCAAGSLTFRVRDRGMGIPPVDQPYLFTPFRRGANAQKISGTGLGLAIVKRCVDVHGGQITFDSEMGRGTTFTVILPNSSM